MIEQVDAQLKKWAAGILNGVDISLEPPANGQSSRGASFYLLDLIDSPPLRGSQRPPLQFLARYLVTTWAEQREEAHHLLSQLVFAAMQNREYSVELAAIPAATWAAFGVLPRPAFLLHIPVRLERPQPDVPVVRVPIVVDGTPMIQLHGVVLGPGDIPLAQARVSLPSLQRDSYTDSRGRFQLHGVPAGQRQHQLHILAKGNSFEVMVEQSPSSNEPAVIRLPLFEQEKGKS